MPCCDDPECECNNPICIDCGEPLFGFEMGPKCDQCCQDEYDEDELQTPQQECGS